MISVFHQRSGQRANVHILAVCTVISGSGRPSPAPPGSHAAPRQRVFVEEKNFLLLLLTKPVGADSG